MADKAPRTKQAGGFPELELDFRPSSRPAAEEDDGPDELEQPLTIELAASPSDRRVGRAPAPPISQPQAMSLADTVAADGPSSTRPASVRVADGGSAFPPITAAGSSMGPAPTVASSGLGAASGPPPAHVSVVPAYLARRSSSGPAARTLASEVDVDDVLPPTSAMPATPPEPRRDPVEIARGVAAASSRPLAGVAMVGAAVLLSLLNLAYTRATNEIFPINFAWFAIPLALGGGGVLVYRFVRSNGG